MTATTPPLSPSLPPTASVPDATVLALVHDVALLARTLCSGLAPDRLPREPALRPGSRARTLEATTTVVVRGHAEGHLTLARWAGSLEGWRCRIAPGRVARLEARRDGSLVEASYVEEERVLVLRVVSTPVAVTREQSLRLRTAGRVAS